MENPTDELEQHRDAFTIRSPEKGIIELRLNGETIPAEPVHRPALVQQLRNEGVRIDMADTAIRVMLRPSLTGGKAQEMKIRDSHDGHMGYIKFLRTNPDEAKILMKQMQVEEGLGKGYVSVAMGLLAEVLIQDGVSSLVGDIDKTNDASARSRETVPRILGNTPYETEIIGEHANMRVFRTTLTP